VGVLLIPVPLVVLVAAVQVVPAQRLVAQEIHLLFHPLKETTAVRVQTPRLNLLLPEVAVAVAVGLAV
jgi:hypothetical protein